MTISVDFTPEQADRYFDALSRAEGLCRERRDSVEAADACRELRNKIASAQHLAEYEAARSNA